MTDRTLFMQSLLPGKQELGLEIAPAHNPVCRKSEGWNVKSVDVFSTEELLYHMSKNEGHDLTQIEPVDIVWKHKALHENIDPALHGKFKYIVASHVFEHIPDMIRFLQSMKILLAPDGFVLFALPDRRYMFDFFRPFSTAAEAIEAYNEKRERHNLRSAFLTYFYTCWVGHLPAWNEPLLPTCFQNTFPHAVKEFDICMEKLKHEYVDMHAWAFTPASFRLMMLELQLLDYHDLAVTDLHRPPGIKNEFFPVLKLSDAKIENVDKVRFDLALASVLEYSNGAELALRASPSLAAKANLPLTDFMDEKPRRTLQNPSSRKERILIHVDDIKIHVKGMRDHLINIFKILFTAY